MRLKVLGGLLALAVTTAVLLLGLVGGAAGGHGKGRATTSPVRTGGSVTTSSSWIRFQARLIA